jgi:hypothetical protein
MWVFIAIVLLAGVIGAIARGIALRPDYGSMQPDARYVWENHRSAPDTKLFGYLPTTIFYLWPWMVWMPHVVGVCCYALLNLGYVVLILWMLHRWWWPPVIAARPPPTSALFVWPVLIVAANLEHALQANQVTLLVLVLCAGGVTLLGRDRQWLGGLLLGLAGLIKVLPFLLIGPLVLRRKWRALGGVVGAILLFDLLPAVLFFGLQGTINEHLAWRQRAGVYGGLRTIEQPLQWAHAHRSDFSYAAVLARWLRTPPPASRAVVVRGEPPADVLAQRKASLSKDEYLVMDPRPLRDPHAWSIDTQDVAWTPRFHLADLSVRAVQAIWLSTLAAIGLLLVWLTWRGAAASKGETAAAESPQEWFALASLWLLAMFYFTPLMRHYYLLWAFPAVVVVYHTLVAEGLAQGGRWTAGKVLAAAALAGWVIGEACLGWDVVRWYGVHMAAVTLLAAATIWAYLRIRGAKRVVTVPEPALQASA